MGLADDTAHNATYECPALQSRRAKFYGVYGMGKKGLRNGNKGVCHGILKAWDLTMHKDLESWIAERQSPSFSLETWSSV